MPDVTIVIGGKTFTVACQSGEEDYLKAAAEMLDREADALIAQIGRMPEVRMLLMAGLMLADRTAAFEERALAAEEKLARQEALIAEMKAMQQAAPPSSAAPAISSERLAALAAEAEALADRAEEKARG